jgi:hypothetical protein
VSSLSGPLEDVTDTTAPRPVVDFEIAAMPKSSSTEHAHANQS